MRACETARVLPRLRLRMSDPRLLRCLFGAAAHLCQVEVELAAAGYPELVAKLEDIRAVIDLEIAGLAPDDLSQPHCY